MATQHTFWPYSRNKNADVTTNLNGAFDRLMQFQEFESKVHAV
jgi:hypothetical protein